MTKMDRRPISWFGVLLIISLLVNIFLIYKYTDVSRNLNTTWSNAAAKFARTAHWVSLDAEELADNPITRESLKGKDVNLRLLEEELEGIKILPFSEQIFPYNSQEKIRILIGYQKHVLELLKQDVTEQGRVSADNKVRIRQSQKAWKKLVSVISREENKIDPFALIFQKDEWKKVWSGGVTAVEEVKLPPLPEKK